MPYPDLGLPLPPLRLGRSDMPSLSIIIILYYYSIIEIDYF
jgi:hypothetical protein